VPSNYIFLIAVVDSIAVFISLAVVISIAVFDFAAVIVSIAVVDLTKPYSHAHWAYSQSRWNLWRYNWLHMSRVNIWSKPSENTLI